MVNASVEFSRVLVPEKFTQTITNVPAELENFRGIAISPEEFRTSPDGTAKDRNYLASVFSTGASNPITPRLHYRSIEVTDSPILFTNFFTLVRIGIDDSFHVVPRSTSGGTITYDLFFAFNDLAGTETSLNLTVSRIQVDASSPQAVQSSVPAAIDPIHARVLFRGTRGSKKVYDLFTLLVP